ncbi:precorrin-3B C(17)-methyltransferase [Clostridium sp. Marseille-P2415]|uniref:precorrin-3B C(17)-methyltransferase n=1 Tax=Clostridium sp. Marseille-P2415 TaxID=1805471 RepID=UPI0009888632|nr:precorrin-3B C(17)-methyltransferase [Clostridium sp. Marseille-P2415]
MNRTGKLYVVGIGPGSYEDMTIRAVKALEESQVIVGYTVYADLVRKHFPDKEFMTTPMRREQERCRLAIDEAKKGKTVSMVCSGDSGVYGMSGLILQMARWDPELEIVIIPGVTAALSGGALLGAPLGHDFAVISLSDLLTPMDLIEKRLRTSAQADMIICLYNPSSKKRADYLKRACETVMEYKSPETVCGLVRNIGREEEEMEVMTLEKLRDAQADMFTTIFIGNSMTKEINGRMVTPRGYKHV